MNNYYRVTILVNYSGHFHFEDKGHQVVKFPLSNADTMDCDLNANLFTGIYLTDRKHELSLTTARQQGNYVYSAFFYAVWLVTLND